MNPVNKVLNQIWSLKHCNPQKEKNQGAGTCCKLRIYDQIQNCVGQIMICVCLISSGVELYYGTLGERGFSGYRVTCSRTGKMAGSLVDSLA